MLPQPEAMKHVRLMLLQDDAQAVAAALAGLQVIHLQPVEHCDQVLDEFPAREFSELFHRIRTRYRKILALHGEHRESGGDITLRQAVSRQHTEVSASLSNIQSMQTLDEELKVLWLKVSALEERMRQNRDQRAAVTQLQNSLTRFQALDIDLSRVGRNSRFLKVLGGSIQNSESHRLGDALSLLGYLLEVFYSSDNTDYVLIAGPSEHAAEVDELLKSADFRALDIPSEFGDRPSEVSSQLDKQAMALDQALRDIESELDLLIGEHVEVLSKISSLVYEATPYAGLAPYLKGKGRLVFLQGWAPAARQQEIEERLREVTDSPFLLLFDEPERDQYAQVPTQLESSALVRPFQALVRQYGLPQYGEVDPGALFAISYTLMFGMMFGDIGHGGVIVMLSLMLRHRSIVIAVIGGMAGLSSMLFGFLYGSIFGYEHVLHPLWMSPMHDPQRMLVLALYWGMGFLIIANLLAIRNRLARADWRPALIGPQGLVGLTIYLLAAYALVLAIETSAVIPVWVCCLLSVLMPVILYNQWRESEGGVGERFLVVLIEGLEFIISNVSATLSFLRVAAFSLNHIALAAAVFAIAAMLGDVGHWVTIVLGNIFIIVLEGAIVAIQCLRLEYYEGFSRFFTGKGRPFEPLRADYP